MKKKAVKFYVLFLILSAFFLLLKPFNNKENPLSIYYYCIFSNSIKMDFPKDDQNDLKLIFENEDNQIKNMNPDYYEIIKNNKHFKPVDVVLFDKGKYLNEIPNLHGKQSLRLYYKDMEIGNLGHFKTNANYIHEYNITGDIKGDTIYVKMRISGPNFTNDFSYKKLIN